MDSTPSVAPPPIDPLLAKKLSRNLPTPFAIAVRRMGHGEIQPSATLSRQIALLDGLLRCWFFILDIERRALGLPPGNETRKLFDQLHKPTLGMWRAAAEETVRLMEGRTRILPSFGACFLEEGPRTAWLNATQLRNHVAHSSGLASVPEHRASELLASLQPLVLQLLPYTRDLGVHPLFSIERVGNMSHGKVTFYLRTFLGRDTRQVCHLCDQLKPHLGIPLLLTPDGTVLHLSPWFQVREREPGGEATLFLFQRNGHLKSPALYDRPDLGAGASPLEADQVNPDFSTKMAANGCLPDLHNTLQPDRPTDAAESASNRVPLLDLPPHLRPIRQIGEGGSGIAYLVRGPDLTETVFKVLHATLSVDGEQAERLAREAQILSDLDHPGVIRVLGLLPTPSGGRGLWLPFIDGPNLAEHINKRGPLPPAEAIGLIRQVLEAVGHVHARGVLHRDIKPSNILLRPTGEPVLIDFGLARQPDAAPLTETGALLGTWSFAAPEIQGRQRPSVRSDLYSVGRVLEFLLTADQNSATWRQSCAPGLQRLLRKALHPNPDHRFADAATFLRALDWADDPAPFAWGAGDTLPGGIRITRRLDTGFPPFAILRGTAPDGSAASVLITEPGFGARARLYQLHQLAPPALRAYLGSLHVQVTEDGHPYLHLHPDLDVHGLELLHRPNTFTPNPDAGARKGAESQGGNTPSKAPETPKVDPPRPKTQPSDSPKPPPQKEATPPPKTAKPPPANPPPHPTPKPTIDMPNLDDIMTVLGLLAAGALVGNAVSQQAGPTHQQAKPGLLATIIGQALRNAMTPEVPSSTERAHRLSLGLLALAITPTVDPPRWLQLHRMPCGAVIGIDHVVNRTHTNNVFVANWRKVAAGGELVPLAQAILEGRGTNQSERLLQLLVILFNQVRHEGWAPPNNELARIVDNKLQIRTGDARSGWLEV